MISISKQTPLKYLCSYSVPQKSEIILKSINDGTNVEKNEINIDFDFEMSTNSTNLISISIGLNNEYKLTTIIDISKIFDNSTRSDIEILLKNINSKDSGANKNYFFKEGKFETDIPNFYESSTVKDLENDKFVSNFE